MSTCMRYLNAVGKKQVAVKDRCLLYATSISIWGVLPGDDHCMRHPVECSIRSAFIGGVFHMSTVVRPFHAIGYELVDNGLSYFNTAMATELGHFNDCDRIL